MPSLSVAAFFCSLASSECAKTERPGGARPSPTKVNDEAPGGVPDELEFPAKRSEVKRGLGLTGLSSRSDFQVRRSFKSIRVRSWAAEPVVLLIASLHRSVHQIPCDKLSFRGVSP